MRSRLPSVGGTAVLAVLFVFGMTGSTRAEFNVNINLGPPSVVVAEPAEVVLAPGIDVYFVPGKGPDLFFSAGFWWSPKGDRWYRSGAANGPWLQVEHRHVPSEVVRMPRDYRVRYAKGKHVPYGQWKKTHGRNAHDNGRHGDGGGKGKGHQKKNKKGHRHDD